MRERLRIFPHPPGPPQQNGVQHQQPHPHQPNGKAKTVGGKTSSFFNHPNMGGHKGQQQQHNAESCVPPCRLPKNAYRQQYLRYAAQMVYQRFVAKVIRDKRMVKMRHHKVVDASGQIQGKEQIAAGILCGKQGHVWV